MSFNRKSDEGSIALPKFADHFLITAASTNDNTAVTSDYIDRLGYESAIVCLSYMATLTSAAALQLQVKVSDCDTSGGSYAAFETLRTNASLCTADAGTATEDVEGLLYYHVDLADADRYIQINTVGNLTAGSSDTCNIATSVILMGATTLVAS